MPSADQPDRIEQLQKDLNLSDAQIAKIKAIMDAKKVEMDKLAKASENEYKVTHEAMMKIKKETDEKITALLTKEQKETFTEMQKKQCEKFNRRQEETHCQPPMFGHIPPEDQPPLPPEEFVKELKKELNFTSDQETKIQKILEAQSEEVKKMFESAKKDREAKREEMKKEREAMHEKMEKQRKETDAKISAVLTDNQKKKYEELQKKNSQRPPRMPKPENEQDRPMHEECPDRNE
jgi:Spy/CpxP family protein refolding chaperone